MQSSRSQDVSGAEQVAERPERPERDGSPHVDSSPASGTVAVDAPGGATEAGSKKRGHSGPRRRRRTARGRAGSKAKAAAAGGRGSSAENDGDGGDGAAASAGDGGSAVEQGRLKLADFLERRPTVDRLYQRNILRDASLNEPRSAAAVRLESRLTQRPDVHEIMERNVIFSGAVPPPRQEAGARSSRVDPGISAAQRRLARQRSADHLSRSLKNRHSVAELRERGILVVGEGGPSGASSDEDEERGSHGPPVEATGTLERRGRVIEAALLRRPPVRDLVRSKLIKSVMLWSQMTFSGADTVPTERNCHTLTLVGRKLVVLGGFSITAAVGSAPCVLDIDKNRWFWWNVSGPSARGPSPRYSHTAVAVGSLVYCFGGFNADLRWLDDLYALDTERRRWVWLPERGTKPSPRAAHSCVKYGSKLVFFGGNDGMGLYNDLHTFDTKTNEWERVDVAGSSPAPRTGHGAAVLGDRMFVFGGTTGLGGDTYNDLYVLDMASWAWYRPSFEGTPPEPRGGHSCTMIGDQLFVFGGNNNHRSFNDVHILDTQRMAWSRPSDAGAVPSMRAGHAATAVGSCLVAFGGGSPEGVCYNDLHVLDTAYDFYPDAGRRRGSVSRLAGVSWSDYDALSDLADMELEAVEAAAAAAEARAAAAVEQRSGDGAGGAGTSDSMPDADREAAAIAAAAMEREAAKVAAAAAAAKAKRAAQEAREAAERARSPLVDVDDGAASPPRIKGRNIGEVHAGVRWADVAATGSRSRGPPLGGAAPAAAMLAAALGDMSPKAASPSAEVDAAGSSEHAAGRSAHSRSRSAVLAGSDPLGAVLVELHAMQEEIKDRMEREEVEWQSFLATSEAMRQRREDESAATLRRLSRLEAELRSRRHRRRATAGDAPVRLGAPKR